MNAPTRPWEFMTAAEKAEAIKPLILAGESYGAVASKFGASHRSCIAGVVNRMRKAGQLPPSRGKQAEGSYSGIASRARAKAAKAKEAKAPKTPVQKKPARVIEGTPWRGPNNTHGNDIKGRAEQRAASPGLPAHLIAGEPRRHVEDTVVPLSRRLKLVELDSTTCKWPSGDPLTEDFGFCGHHAPDAGPYCSYHARLAFVPPAYRLSVPKGA